MARVNLNTSPYYDDTDINKQYYQLLAIPGRVAQAREITALQTTLRNIIKSVGDSILKNGDIIEGCQVLVNGDKVTVTEGRVYMEGIVMPVAESVVSIKGTGTETIGVKLMEAIIDEYADSTLRDPAQGYDNYNQPGCTRLKRWLEVVVDDPEAAILSTLSEGSVMVESYAPEYDTLTQTLARRTYDESGSYLVDGLKVRVEYLNESQYNVVIESGKAYVLGYELKIPTARRVISDRSTTYNNVTVSNNMYSTDTKEYLLDSSPHVRAITNVNGRVSKEVTQTINTNVDSVLLPDTDVVRIISVTQGDKVYNVGSTSANGDCYLLRSGNTYMLKWNGTENYPASGTSYNVIYEYNKDFMLGVDYELIMIDRSHYLSWIDGGDHPLDETLFSVVYEQYLARKDLVYMDRYGNIEVVKGVPAEYGFEVLPEAPLNTLTLAHINNPPNGSTSPTSTSEGIIVSNVGLTRFTMNDIQSLLNRVQTIEYDQAVLSLNDDARQVETTSDKKGIFTEPLVDLSRIDFYYNLNNEGETIDTELPIYDMALDLASNICYLPIVTSTHNVEYNSLESTTNRYGRLVSLSATGENVLLSQMNATKSFLINPYSMFPQMPEVSIDPAVDNWIEDTIIQVPRSITDSTIVNMSTRTIDNTTAWMNRNSNYATRSSSSTSETAIGTRTNVYTSDSVISEQSVTYIRRRTITVEGNNFPESLDNIYCKFDGVIVPLTPIETTLAGTMSGTVKANSSGHFKATFTIPEGVLTGTREVLLKSDTPVEGMITEGFTLYIAAGTSRRIERTVTTVTTVLLERVTTTTLTNVYVDPVGQTFVLDRMSVLKGIDLYFENKPSVNTPVICEIREVNNGTITSTVYAHKSLPASAVQVSADASVATRFNFDDPALLEENKEYAFVVRSTSDAYRLWVAELGGIDISTKDLVLKNAYMTGVMMSSSNNSTWTAHQTTDVKFRLIEDVYAQNSIMQFNKISSEDIARLYLTADSASPTGTSIDWYYSVDGTNYKSITPYNVHLLGDTHNEVTLRARLMRDMNSKLTPLVALDTIGLTTSHYDMKGSYVSRNVSGLDPYTEIKVIVDVYEPAGTQITVRVSTDGGTTVQDTVRGSSTTLNYGWQEVVFTTTVANSTQFRVILDATSNTKYLTPSFRRLRCIMS